MSSYSFRTGSKTISGHPTTHLNRATTSQKFNSNPSASGGGEVALAEAGTALGRATGTGLAGTELTGAGLAGTRLTGTRLVAGTATTVGSMLDV